MRLASTDGFARPRADLTGSASAASAAARQDANWVSWRPSRRNNAPRSLALHWLASKTTRHFSAPVHCFSVRLRDGVIPSTVGAFTNHRESTGCDTPTSRANAVALTARGPTIRSTIRDRNAALYSLTSIPTIAPSR